MRTFEDVFHAEAEALASAPGRVNLLGEHTDYNDGFVLPTVIPQRTEVSVRRSGEQQFRLFAADLNQLARFGLDVAPTEQFARYVHGCLKEIADHGFDVPPLDLHVQSSVPIGLGLSSSAALEVATLRAVRKLLEIPLDDEQLAVMAQRAEVQYAGVHCGIMDQMASSLCEPGRMLWLDTRSLERALLPLPADSQVLVIDSGVSRALADTAYNERRQECEAAARLLGVTALRDVGDHSPLSALPSTLQQRVRHVVSENQRVLAARRELDAPGFGALMNASHDSLRHDFEVSIPALDMLVDALRAQADVFGARLTGAGFGGACVALCRAGTAESVAGAALERYRHAGHLGRMLVPYSQGSTPQASA